MKLDQKPEKSVLSPGVVLDERFEIAEFLGAGSFGEVYRAKQLIFGHHFRDVALKLFGEEKVTAGNVYDVFSDAITLIGLQEENPSPEVSRHLIQVYDMGVLQAPASRAFMSMKLVPGKKTLQSAVRQFRHAGGMPVSLTLRYLRQMLLPLTWMHSLDPAAVHGDLKPDNVLMTEDSDLVLTDFGLAVRMPLSSLGGAIQYQAPEKLSDQEAAAPSDMYAVGIMWYEMLTGRHPFADVGLEATADGDEMSFITAHQQARKWEIRRADPNDRDQTECRIPPASELNQELREHPQLEGMLNRCLAYRQSERYPNARLLLTHVDEYIKNGHIPAEDVAIVIGPPQEERCEQKHELRAKPTEALVTDAETLVAQGEPGKAVEVADVVLRDKPHDVPALLVKTRALVKLKRIEEAKQTCEKARRKAPKDPGVFDALADIHDAEGKPSLARTLRACAAKSRSENRILTKRRF